MTVYLDMDGVIADFFGGLAKEFQVDHWKSIQDKHVALAKLANTDFFGRLPTFRESRFKGAGACLSQVIVNSVKEVSNGDWGICSSPLRGDTNNSSYWKRRWLEDKNFMPDVEKCIFTSNKHKYAWSILDHRPNILIDDRPQNIIKWQNAGGIGILFQTDENDIEEELLPELEQAIRIR
tara:strand:- start:658 stop:1194 length:537 start_codon:yes stop_codon:yes gene_type:complete